MSPLRGSSVNTNGQIFPPFLLSAVVGKGVAEPREDRGFMILIPFPFLNHVCLPRRRRAAAERGWQAWGFLKLISDL